MIVKAKNLDVVNQSYPGWVLLPGQEIELTNADITNWKAANKVIDDISNNILQIGDDTQYFSTHAEQISHLFHLDTSEVDAHIFPFTEKKTKEGKKIYRRKYGFSISVNANTYFEKVLTVPYANVKINELELCNCSIGDSVDLSVYDTIDGLYQQSLGVPAESVDTDLMLNQFGFGVRLPEGFYKDVSSYDADLIYGMRIKLNYVNNTNNNVIIYGNIIYHEVK